jgi:hypothetical protein
MKVSSKVNRCFRPMLASEEARRCKAGQIRRISPTADRHKIRLS